MTAIVVPVRHSDRLRWLLAPLAAAFIVWLLLIVMRLMIRAPEVPRAEENETAVEMVRVEKPKDDAQQDTALPSAAPPQAPPAPPSLARPSLPSIAVAPIAISPAPSEISVATGGSLALGQGLGLGSSGAFGGFARGGGGGGGGSGYGTGQGFRGKDLVPLSTARPQMPDWACKQKIKGWVEAVFTVNTGGRVENVKIVDAQPRGVYEAAAIESISNWIYERVKQPIEVDQRVEMDPDDCQYNWR